MTWPQAAMRILYGVVGEGMGHAMRSRVILEHLVQQHDVHIVVSGRARDYLARRFENVHHIWGLSIKYGDNSVRMLGTVLQNLRGAISGLPQNIRTYYEILDKFEPDVVISDFETFSAMFAQNHFLPVISIDNIQIINRCTHEADLLGGHEDSFELIRSIVKAKVPYAYHYLITTFFYPPVRRERTTLVPPILRPEILGARSESGEHLLVYQTHTGGERLMENLKKAGLPCRVYGYRRDLTEDVVDENLTFRPFSEVAFIDDLRTARAVVAGGSFTLMSEAVYLKKPMLSLPIAGQFEQVLNALYLEKLGYGMHAESLDKPATLSAFLERLPDCDRALSRYGQQGNEELFGKLDALLASALARKGSWAPEPQGTPG